MLTMFIAPGAGGEESQDFAFMLTKMYAVFLGP
jgi:protein subunit release factor B